MSRIWRKLIPSGLTTVFLVILIVAVVCCRIALVASKAQDLSDISGYSELKGGIESTNNEMAAPPPDLLKVLSQADYLGETVEFSESEINRYLHMTLSPKQNGVFNLITRIDGVWIRLHEGFIELIIERRVQGYKTIFPHQTSYFIKIERADDANTTASFNGGEIYGGLATKAAMAGQLQLPQLALPLIERAAYNVAAVYEKEIEFLTQKAARLEINDDRVLYVGRGTGKP